jgi:hypothetical protein
LTVQEALLHKSFYSFPYYLLLPYEALITA